MADVLRIGGHRDDNGELSEFERRLVPKSFRIDVPLRHSRELRDYAEQLRILANALDDISRSDAAERYLLSDAWSAGKQCAWNIKESDRIRRHKR